MSLRLCSTFLVCASGGTPTLLLNIMDSQLEKVQHRIYKAEEDLATAEDRGDEEKVKFVRGQLISLQEKETILLRSQASSKPCRNLVHTG